MKEKLTLEELEKRKANYSSKWFEENTNKQTKLLGNIKQRMPELEELLAKAGSDWEYEDPVYRYYHHSFKVYRIQDLTSHICQLLCSLAPEGTAMNKMFMAIMSEGASGKQFNTGHNADWDKHTRPFLEAFFHARFFLEMAVKYGKQLDSPSQTLPSGWAALLYLYNLR